MKTALNPSHALLLGLFLTPIAAVPAFGADPPAPTTSVPSSSSPAPDSTAAPSGPTADAMPTPAQKTLLQIDKWRQRTVDRPTDAAGWAGLADALLQRARETNDPDFYTKAEEALARAKKINPELYQVFSLRSQLHSTRHQFPEAISWVEKAVKANPNDPLNYGLLGDIYAELGQYDKVEENYQKMMDLKPGRAAYSRASYLHELYGEERDARTMMVMAINAGPARGEGTAWCQVHLGDLDYSAGFLPAAQQAYEAALRSFPDFFHAYAGMGRVKTAQKDYPGAIEMYLKALKAGPHHEVYGALIELYILTGQKEKAKAVREQLGNLQKKYARNGMDIDFEVAEIDAEGGKDLPNALRLAKEEVNTHANVKAYDGLAWIAFLNDDLTTAQAAMDQALRLGTRTPVFYYHAARIQEALGHQREGISLLNAALSKCPYFHARYAANARERVAQLTRSIYADSTAQAPPDASPVK